MLRLGRTFGRTFFIVLVALLMPIVSLAAGCTPVFSALSFNGVQYPVHAAHGYPPPVLSGVLSLNLQFETRGGVVETISGVSLRYTIDNQPVGPVLANNFAWLFDTSTIADGAHTLSVLYVNEPAPGTSCYTLLGRQYVFVVSNSGQAITGSQVVPAVAPPLGNGLILPQYADFVTYPGSRTHSAPHPFGYSFIAPANSGANPADLWAEPLLSPSSITGEPLPAYWQLKNGSIVEDPLYSSLFYCDDLRQPAWLFDLMGSTWEQRKAYFDGSQDDVGISSYTTFTANLDGPGYYGVGLDGRLILLNMDGSVQTLAGWVAKRAITPFEYLDDSIPLSAVQGQQQLIGNFDAQFNFASDLAIDPRNHAHIFVADMNNHRIAMIDLSQSPPVISTYAGVVGQPGYLDGPAASSLFNQPSSLAIAADGTMYVADAENSLIRKIDPARNVTTLVGLGPSQEPSTNVVAAAPLTYAPLSAVPFASAYVNYPNSLRFDSVGNLALAETVTQTIRYINLSANTVTTLAQISPVGNPFGEHIGLDVDRKGNVGNRDDIIVTLVAAEQNGLFRVPIAGTTAVPPPTVTAHATNPLYSGHSVKSAVPWTVEPWSAAIDDQEGRLLVSGVQSTGVVSLRLVQTTDPAYKLNLADYSAGRNIWITGTAANFPFGSRPSFAALHGVEGHSGLGNVLNFDDMVSMTDAALGSYLQSGADGSVPRPELTGNDLRNVIYYIRRTATGGDLVTPGADSTDQTAPTIGVVAATQTDSTDAKVTWTTSEPTLGFVAWGTTSGNYFGWSPIESGYATSHSVAVSNLPAGQTIYFMVLAKDQAGNQGVSPEQTLILH